MPIDSLSWHKTLGRICRCRCSNLCKYAGERDQTTSLLPLNERSEVSKSTPVVPSSLLTFATEFTCHSWENLLKFSHCDYHRAYKEFCRKFNLKKKTCKPGHAYLAWPTGRYAPGLYKGLPPPRERPHMASNQKKQASGGERVSILAHQSNRFFIAFWAGGCINNQRKPLRSTDDVKSKRTQTIGCFGFIAPLFKTTPYCFKKHLLRSANAQVTHIARILMFKKIKYLILVISHIANPRTINIF